jgi:C-terminal processing protease CtpA/Prc
MFYQKERKSLIIMKTYGKGLITISVCLLFAFLGCHRTPPPPDYANQPSCQLKRAQLGFLYNFNNPQPEVLKVEPNYPAEKADIRPGDIFVSINQSPVNTRGDFKAIMETIKTETPTSIVVKRNSEHITKTVVPKIVGESVHLQQA